jgi:Mrp family chromosome partitioning ATPase
MIQFRRDSGDVDLSPAYRAVRAKAEAILAIGVLVGAAAYALSAQQGPTFEARATLLSATGQTGNALVNATLVSAPPLPSGALETVMSSGPFVSRLVETVKLLPIGTERVTALVGVLEEAARGGSSPLSLRSRIDLGGSGTYVLSARATAAADAAVLANSAAEALVSWDSARGRAKVGEAREALETSMAQIDARLARLQLGDGVEQRTLVAQRAERLDQLNLVRALEGAFSGTLSVLAPAVPPTVPVRPRPLRDGLLAGALALVVASFVAVAIGALLPKFFDGSDLASVGLLRLGEVQRVRGGRRGTSVLVSLRRGSPREQVASLAASLVSRLGGKPNVVVVTSAVPREGKSTIAAALAADLSGSGQRTLLIDADVHHPSQEGLWGIAAQGAEWVNLPQAAPFEGEESRTLATGLVRPETAQARRLQPHLHFLSGGGGVRHLLVGGLLQAAVARWKTGYDFVIIDSPPILAVADTLHLVSVSDGVLLIVESGRTGRRDVNRALEALELVGATVLGGALNKSRVPGKSYYGYSKTREWSLPEEVLRR